jgi:hypothetical protein
MGSMIRLIAALLLCMTQVAVASDTDSVESRKIDYLITAIESLPNTQFIRNGTAYDAKAAGDHLRLKWKNAGSKVRTAEDFIRLCGSVSSMSGKPYEIRFADGKTITSESFLRDKLAQYKEKP